MDYTKPLYIFVLATRNNHQNFDLNEILKDPLPPKNDPAGIRPCVTGSSLALGCWEQPKEAVPTKEGFYVYIVNNEIEAGSSFKWVDLSGQYEPANKDHMNWAWEPMPIDNRTFDIGRPQPNEAGACLCMSWGDPNGKVIYFPLPNEKVSTAKPQTAVSEDQITPTMSSESATSPASNGPVSPTPDEKTPRQLIPDRKEGSISSGRRSTRKRMGDSFRRVRRSISNLFTCTSSRTQDE